MSRFKTGDRVVFRHAVVEVDVSHVVVRTQEVPIGEYVFACCNKSWPAGQLRHATDVDTKCSERK